MKNGIIILSAAYFLWYCAESFSCDMRDIDDDYIIISAPEAL